MIVNIIIPNHDILSNTHNTTYVIIKTKMENIFIHASVCVNYKQPSPSMVYNFIKDGCFSIGIEPDYFNILNNFTIIGKVVLDKKKVIECLREARGIDLWTTYMDETQRDRFDKILSDLENLISE